MKLVEELGRLEELHGELLAKAKVTVGLLEKGEVEAMEDAWAQRRRLFKRLTAQHRKLAPLLEDWQRTRGELSAAEAGRAEDIMAKVRGVGRRVLALDRRAAELLEQSRAEALAELEKVGRGQKLQRAYRRQTGGWGPDRLSRTG
jgi:hypothetical protein